MALNKADEWYTPPEIVELAKEVMGSIDLDPASNKIAQEWIKADLFYTQETNGLDKPWNGKIWLNPPYSAVLIKKFTTKFVEEYAKGNMDEGIILTNSGTDTAWNQNIAKGVQVYTVGRISFMQPDKTLRGKGGRGQCFTYLGPNPKKFIDVFTKDNFCWCPNISIIQLHNS